MIVNSVGIKDLDISSINSFRSVLKKWNLQGDFNKYITTPEYTGIKESTLHNSNTSDVYAAWDDLINNYPLFVSKILLGYGSDANGNSDETLPIYEYVISPCETSQTSWSLYNESDTKLTANPLILVVCCVHGDEKSTTWSTLHFINQLLSGWASDETLYSIKSNVKFKIIPVANPFGYNGKVRTNARGVDPARNFEPGWASGATSGTAPLSEKETQLLATWMAENNNAIAFIDYHNFNRNYGNRDVNMASYFISNDESVISIYSAIIRRCSDKWRGNYFTDDTNRAYGYVSRHVLPNPGFHAEKIIKIPLSASIEITLQHPVSYAAYTQTVMETGSELIANYIVGILSAYKE